MTLGQRIQELRKQAGLSQEALGETLGVSRQAVSKWEGDNGIPELDTLIAMSRLFGVTLGQLLGVETPEEREVPPETAPGFTEEQVENILRRYVEESKKQEEPPKNTVGSYPLGSWIIAACAVLITVVMIVVAIRQVREIKQSVNTLWNNVADVEEIVTNVRNQVGGLSDELRGVLEEQNSLLSSFEYEVVSFNVVDETVELKLNASLKTYTAGTKAQFILNWLKTNQTAGELVCDPVEGPKFETTVTIPMNYHLEVDVLVIDEDGTLHEQPADTIYSGMHPDEFKIQMRSAGMMSHGPNGKLESFSYDGEFYSKWPELLYPVKIETVIILDGKEFTRREEKIETLGDGTYHCWGDEIIFVEPVDESTFECWFIITNNYGMEEKIQIR